MRCLFLHVVPLSVLLIAEFAACSINCIKACNEVDSAIVCNQSLILISDVTNWMLEKNHIAFEKMKHECMGKELCDLSKVCGHEYRQTLVVHYLCVDANHIRSKPCNGNVIKMKGNSGYIQSPGYPSLTNDYIPCKWQIEPPNDNVVVLSLHDIAVSPPIGSTENCDGGLVVSGRSCDGESSVFVRRSLCGGDNLTSLVRCGKVDVELSQSQRAYPLRFWLSFHVHSKNQASSFQASLLPCSGWIYDMGTDSRQGFKETLNPEPARIPAFNNTETNTEVLIIMLSIISGISAVLLIILIVVCVRCRLLQASHIETVYTDPSPALQAHYKYISSLESDKTRPQLSDGYCEVADALPFTQRGETPTSPAYAEVEQFAHLRKSLWSSSSEEVLKGSKPILGEGTHGDSEQKIAGDKYSDVVAVSSENVKPKRGVLGRRKHEKDKQGNKGKSLEIRNSTGPTIIPVKVEKKASSGNNSELPNPPSSLAACKGDGECYVYEQYGEFVPAQSSFSLDLNSSALNTKPELGINGSEICIKGSSSENYTKTLGRVKDSSKLSANKSSIVEKLSSQDAFLTCAPKKPPRLTESASYDFSKHSKTLPLKNAKAYLSENKTNNTKLTRKDVPQTLGIVKNGIKKFEQNEIEILSCKHIK